MGECFNCGTLASNPCTLVFESGVTLSDRLLCPDCRAFFSRSRAIEVLQAPVLMRGSEVVEEE